MANFSILTVPREGLSKDSGMLADGELAKKFLGALSGRFEGDLFSDLPLPPRRSSLQDERVAKELAGTQEKKNQTEKREPGGHVLTPWACGAVCVNWCRYGDSGIRSGKRETIF